MIDKTPRENKKAAGCIFCGRPPALAVEWEDRQHLFCRGHDWVAYAACRMPGAELQKINPPGPTGNPGPRPNAP